MGLMGKIRYWIDAFRRLWHRFWNAPMDRLSRRMLRLRRDIRIVWDLFRSYSEREMGFKASALSFQCAVSLIPMLAIFFALTSGFGLADQLKELLYSKIPAEPDLIDMILLASENIIDAARSGFFGLISTLTFVWTVIWLFLSVEDVFNSAWGVTKTPRSYLKRFGVDLVMLFTLPFVILIFFGGSVVYSHVLDVLIPGIPGITEHVKGFLSWLILCAVVILTLSSMYKFIPATHVHYRNAFKAAVFAGIAFTGLQYLYLETQVMVTRLNTFYGAVAAIPLFLIWLNYSWQIVLYGAQLSYSFQKNQFRDIPDETTEKPVKR